MMVPQIQTTLQGAAAILQPLCEVGSEEKSQFWDIDDVMQALRIANRHGIPLQKLKTLQAPLGMAS